MADPLDELAAIIAEKALQRLRPDFSRAGREQPTCATPAEQPKECNIDGCAPCEELMTCSARELFNIGTARLTPSAIRTSKDLAPYIDHTLLKPDATRDDLVKLCNEARRYGFATVCVNSSNVGPCARLAGRGRRAHARGGGRRRGREGQRRRAHHRRRAEDGGGGREPAGRERERGHRHGRAGFQWEVLRWAGSWSSSSTPAARASCPMRPPTATRARTRWPTARAKWAGCSCRSCRAGAWATSPTSPACRAPRRPGPDSGACASSRKARTPPPATGR